MMLTPARRFLTLTTRPEPGLTPGEALDRLNASWRSLWKRWKRQFGDSARGYVKVVELTKAGWPHLHILLDTPYIPQRAIARAWRELAGSPIVDIRRIASQRAMARYLAKYLTKARIGIEHHRRWSQSATFLPPLPPRELAEGEIQLTWRFTNSNREELAAALLLQGYASIGNYYARAET